MNNRIPKILWLGLLAFFSISFAMSCAGIPLPFDFAFQISTGWLYVPFRDNWAFTFERADLAIVLLSLGVILLGIHCLGTGFTNSSKDGNGQQDAHSWKWRHSLIIVAAVLLSWATGFAIVGAAHQAVNVATSDQTWLEGGRRRTKSRINLKQIGLALHNYHEVYLGFPPGGTFDRVGRPLVSWQTRILPFIEQAPLYDRINTNAPWTAPENALAMATVLEIYRNPVLRDLPEHDSYGRALTHYAGNGVVFHSGNGLRIWEIADGPSNTVLGGEVASNFMPWGQPLNVRDLGLGLNKSPDGFGSPLEGGAHLLMGDGRVVFVSENIDPQLLNALATPDGGEDATDISF